LTATVEGEVSGGDAINYSLSTTATKYSNVGGYPITVSLGSNPNYDVSSFDGTLTINQKTATVTADNKAKTYGDDNPALTATVVGQVAGGDAINYSLSTTAAKFSNVGGYPITVSLGSNPNYSVTKTDGTLTVGKKTATVTADDKAKTYGDDNPALTATVAGQVTGGDAINYSLSTTAAKYSNIGPYPITVSLGSNPNYNVTKTDGTLTVGRKALTVTAIDRSKTYGDALTLGTTGFTTGPGQLVNGDTVTGVTLASAGAAATATVAGSPYTITPSAAVGTGLGNYQISYQLGSLTVNAKALTITANNQSKTYGDGLTLGTTSFTKSGLVNADTVSGVTLTSAGAAATAGAGPYSIVPSAATGTGLGNYTIAYNNGTLTVNKATLVVTAENKSKQYGDANPPFTATYSGYKNGDTLAGAVSGTPSLTTTASSSSVVGTYAITAALGTLTSSNYTFTFANGTLTITPKEAPVAYIGQTAFYSSGSSSTTAQVTLSASVQDVTGSGGTLANATVTFTDLLTGKVLATGVKVTPVTGSSVPTGTANTVVTLSTGQYGAQTYLIEVSLGNMYRNTQQTGAAPGTDPYNAAHPVVTVMIPPTQYTMQGAAGLTKLASAAGTYGGASTANYMVGLKYNNKGTNPQGQIQLILQLPGSPTVPAGTYYVKSNSITSVAFTGGFPSKDVTVYTKASIFRVGPGGTLTSIDGGVTLRSDAHEGCTTSPSCTSSSGDTIGFTVLSSKDSSLYYSNNWVYDTTILGWRTVQQSVGGPGGSAVVIN
jgi:hypothetical protein